MRNEQGFLLKFALLVITCFVIYTFRRSEDDSEMKIWEIKEIRSNMHLENDTKISLLKNLNFSETVLKVDTTNMTNEKILKKIEETNPNLPMDHWDVNDNGPQFNGSCANYANVYKIKFNNVYWQVQKINNETYYLYSAYYDNRTLLNGTGPLVRILAMTDVRNLTENVTCQFWYHNDPKPEISMVVQYQYMWYTYWGNDKAPAQPYLLACSVPSKGRVPASVSLVANPCDNATNNLRVIYKPAPLGKRQNFVICVKALNFQHLSSLAIRLVEWIELHKILGADKIVFYKFGTHPNVTKVLDYYLPSGFIEVSETSLPGGLPNIPDFMQMYMSQRAWGVQYLHELIQYNDCFYRNMYMYDFVVLVDIDEVILPLTSDTWYDLIYKVVIPKATNWTLKMTPASYIVRNVHFMDDKAEYQDWYVDIPKYMHMLQNVHRNASHTGPGNAVKGFHNPQMIKALHNHMPRACINHKDSWCPLYDVDLADAHMQHYCIARHKPECQRLRGKNETILDTSIWKYKERLVAATTRVLKDVGFL
ncbi:uncharacterized protein LOC132205908 [Neocloeon triangulifer]|uniref:uncharacterized protein LOC132205908 n=1 Tax=Neocloeon triangulifer TaxID=2078957 RepID=UPI00286F1AEE|nr:uncharacterized protein LOC132205908 [Neocloeon triangulifer]